MAMAQSAKVILKNPEATAQRQIQNAGLEFFNGTGCINGKVRSRDDKRRNRHGNGTHAGGR